MLTADVADVVFEAWMLKTVLTGAKNNHIYSNQPPGC